MRAGLIVLWLCGIAAADPAPSVSADLEGHGLPAVSADGKLVVATFQGEDGARGMPNLTLTVRDRNDRTVESMGFYVEETDKPPVGSSLAAINHRLVELHRAHDLRPLAPASESVSFDETGHLRITTGGHVVVDKTFTSWLVPDRYVKEEQLTCHNPAYLGDAWIDAARRVALVKISYHGNDTCWEPDSELHVVSW